MQPEPSQSETTPTNPTSTFPLSIEQSLIILGVSTGLGLLADALFRAFPLGLNLSLYTTILAVTLYALPRYAKLKPTINPLLLGCLLILGILFSWRASIFLQVLNIAVQAFLALLIAAQLSLKALRNTNATELLLNSFKTCLGFIFTPFSFLFESRWKDLNQFSQGKNSKIIFSILRGLLFALPLLIIFAILLASADALFENLLNRTFNVNLEKLFEHIITIAFLSALALAYLSQSFLNNHWTNFKSEAPKLLQFGLIETSLVFGSLSLLFISFLSVQASYLFGGDSLVTSSSLSYAEYGRRGFFELVTVTFLLHIVLLLGLWFTENKKAKQLYKTLASLLVVLLYGVIASAFTRLNLYIDTFGLTELRFYSSAMIIWIALIMLYFLVRLHSTRAPKIIPTYLVLGVLGVISLYLINPDQRIAQTNLNRINTATELDVDYLSELSLDAVPALVQHLQKTSPNGAVSNDEDLQLQQLLFYKASQLEKTDWRSFNIGRWQGSKALQGYDVEASGWRD